MKDRVLRNLHGLRWATRFSLALGVVASAAANILHAEPNAISRVISAWPPLALLVTVELISRIPVHQLWKAVVRLIATSGIAVIAAWISYWHMTAVVANYGETGSSVYLLPLTVDGLVIVASISLVELNARIRAYPTGAQVAGNSGQESSHAPDSDLVVAQEMSATNGHRDTTGLVGMVTR